MNERIDPETAVPMKSKKKRLVGGKAPKHGYRTRTGPRCCTANCSATKAPEPAVKYSERLRRRYQS
jgi:hypothetical protein